MLFSNETVPEMMDEDGDKLTHRVTVSLRGDQYAGLQEMAEDMGVTLSDVAREAISMYVLKQHWGGTIGRAANDAIESGLTNEETLDAVMAKFPTAKTSTGSIAWYRAQLRKENPEVPTNRQARAMKATRAG